MHVRILPGTHNPCCKSNSSGTSSSILRTVRIWQRRSFFLFPKMKDLLLAKRFVNYDLKDAGWITRRPHGMRRVYTNWCQGTTSDLMSKATKWNSPKVCTFSFGIIIIKEYLGMVRGWRVIRISGSLIWSKTLMELIFNPCGEFRRSPEGPVSQIHSPHLLGDAPEIFSDLLKFIQMRKWEWGAESNGKLPHLFIPSKTAT